MFDQKLIHTRLKECRGQIEAMGDAFDALGKACKTAKPTDAQIQKRAHDIWVARGQPQGPPEAAEADWKQAQAELVRDYQRAEQQVPWFQHKCKAADCLVETLIQRRGGDGDACSTEVTREDWEELAGLYKEIRAAYAQFRSSSDVIPDGGRKIEKALNGFSNALRGMGRDIEAVGEDGSCRGSFLGLRRDCLEIERHFQSLQGKLDSWTDHFPKGALKPIKKAVSRLSELGRRSNRAAWRATECCEMGQMRQEREKIAGYLTAIYQGYSDVICQVNMLKCLPEIEPPFAAEIQCEMERIGVNVASAHQQLGGISFAEDDLGEELRRGWDSIRSQAILIRNEIDRWAKSQLCPPSLSCQQTASCLISQVEKGVQGAAKLGDVKECAREIECQRQSIEAVYTETVKLATRARELPGEVFNQSVFNPIWWSIASVQTILARCAEEDTECLLTEEQFRSVFEGLWRTASQSGAEPLIARLLLAARRPAMAATSPKVCPTSNGSGATTVSSWVDAWKISETWAQSLQNLAGTDDLRTAIGRLIGQMRSEQSWIQSRASADGTSATTLIGQTEKDWTRIYAGLAAACSAVRSRAADGSKERIAALSQELPALDQRMRSALGLVTATRASVAPVKGGAAS